MCVREPFSLLWYLIIFLKQQCGVNVWKCYLCDPLGQWELFRCVYVSHLKSITTSLHASWVVYYGQQKPGNDSRFL